MSTNSQRQIVIGDVHGHYAGLMTLLEAIAPSTTDQVYFLGDLIDRGPESSQVVRFVKEGSHQCLLGNHEQFLLDAFPDNQIQNQALQSWLYSGGHMTLVSYGEDMDLLLEHVEWMRTLPLYIDLGAVWLVHAGVNPQMPLEAQGAQEFCWVREAFHSHPQPYFPDKLIIAGHTITFTLPGVAPGELAQGAGWLDIDTGAYHPKSGWLTGLDLTNRQVYQVNVYQDCQRTLSWEAAITHIEPAQVIRHRQLLRL
ncbi:serine/threonine protein phosphatase [Neosynechococcus sphagnicola sy1]|uniref:Serine/threonine protein phosphatase n=1 Tax=Neosynechococcus sphagnicola sy1 TaxID=1497020 RepID=A0A098TL14_9CYAN|nr:metallophosphoesterase [Neosynechococcus sphagnicola]KGF73015.1 serine/threonine protein phosphatase [Neosynechococcus sphagnicola sy1]